ncbi:MAG: hypothetical protein LUI14_11645 [Lachnospiraceae bacterium]|nr:hypothetical protein [Lachnospiraceae bacterium]
MEIYTFSQWVLFFYIYCFLGWVFESVYVSISEKHWVNRGFLKGPLLPIYGFGALCVLVVTIPFRDNLPLMCLAGMGSATVLEYVTGAVMEKLFHVRYWDYTGRLLSVNGHICLASVLCWAVMTILVVDVLQVQLEKVVLAVNEQIVTVIVFAVTPFVTGDLVTSFRAAIRLKDVLVYLEHAEEELAQLAERRRELEMALAERRHEMDTLFEKRRSEMETLFEARRSEMETSFEERRNEIEKALEERRHELGMSLEERKIDLEKYLRENGGHGITPVKGMADHIAAVQELTDKLSTLQEKAGRLSAESELLQKLNGKSIRGLLKRNPKAVSYSHRDAFASLKKRMIRKTDETKEEQASDESSAD